LEFFKIYLKQKKIQIKNVDIKPRITHKAYFAYFQWGPII